MKKPPVCYVCNTVLEPGTHDWYMNEKGEKLPICYSSCVGYTLGKHNRPCPCHSLHLVQEESRTAPAPCEQRFHEALEKYRKDQKEGEKALIEVIGDIYFHGCTPDLNPPNEEEWLQYVRSGLKYHGFGVWEIERLIALATNGGGWKRSKF
ncbi:MAG: hypothetical protein ACUVQZ_00355 [Candidatus Caldatribacteriaceae bacterium]